MCMHEMEGTRELKTFTSSGTYKARRKGSHEDAWGFWDYDEDLKTCIEHHTKGAGPQVPAIEMEAVEGPFDL
jgi:hypothetical protein